MIAGEHDVEGDEQPGLRQHQDPDHQDDEDLSAGEAEPCQRDGRQEASTIAAATVTETMMRLFFTLDQKYGRFTASRK